ncbi:MAG: serine/threonine protein kinase, partial [Myxococcota bacterium]
MDTGGTTLAELTTVWDERGIVISDLALAQDGTIVDPRGPNRFPMPAGDTAPLPLADGAALRVGATIGSGGMGLVRSAVQVPLDREVAVKSLRPDVQRTLGAAELVREARVTGRLEHPNIVPIHALAADEDHQPLLVMKRIDGVPWTDYLASKPLDFHLDVLLDVCNALSFAHSRGVIHRDLKPENVMNGAFGEVYLLDWGLAVSTDPELADRMQLARDITRLAGTPQYMAPEMAAANASQIGEQTDVYLLGSVLHECVTGTYRHDGNDLRATLLQSWMSEPKTYDETVPRELGGICNRAAARDP